MRDTLPLVLPLPRLGDPPRPRVPQPERWELDNGLRVVMVSRPGLPQVAARLVVPAGSAADPGGNVGLASLVAALLTEGTATLSADQLAERLDRLGASLSAQVGHDFAELDLVLLSETLEPAMELLAEVVARPSFPVREVERVRAETLDLLEARLDEPANVADDEVGRVVFGPEHPYGRLSMGTAESVEGISRSALVEFHTRHYRPAGSVLVVAGDVRSDVLRPLLERVFSAWQGAPEPTLYPADPAPLGAAPRVELAWPGSAQGEIRVAGRGIERTSPDWIPAAVANYLLGGSTITGRLGANLREDKGWTYGIRSGFAAGVRPAGWVVETAVDVEVVHAAVAEIEGELARFLEAPVEESELARARDTLILSLPRAFETPGRIVGRLATAEAYGLPESYWESFADRVAAVSPDDVLRVARRYFAPDSLARILVGLPTPQPE